MQRITADHHLRARRRSTAAVAAWALALSVSAGVANELAVKMEKFEIRPAAVEVEFRVYNATPDLVRTAVVVCTFIDAAGKSLFMQAGIVGNVRANDSASGTIRIPPDREINGARCRLSEAGTAD